MQAVVSYDFGEMEVESVPKPQPGRGEVLIEVNRVQLSITECSMCAGRKISKYETIRNRLDRNDGLQLFGHEFAGTVVENGENVSHLTEGDRVYAPGKISCGECRYCDAKFEQHCVDKQNIGYHRPGALAEYVVLPESVLCPLPDSVTDAEGAAMQPLASSLLSVHEAQVQTGETVVVIGSGVMGSNIAQIAKRLGATDVFSVDLVPKKLKIAESRGLIPVNAAEVDPVEHILDVTDGVGADVVFEAVGGKQTHMHTGNDPLAQAFRMTRRGGKLVQISNVRGEVAVEPGMLRKKRIDWRFPASGTSSISPNANTGKTAAQFVGSESVSIDEYVTHEFEGLENVETAIEVTLDDDIGLGPAQIVVG